MAWFELDEWEPWNKLALVVAVLLGSLLLLTRPLVWKVDASWLGIIVFVPLAVWVRVRIISLNLRCRA